MEIRKLQSSCRSLANYASRNVKREVNRCVTELRDVKRTTHMELKRVGLTLSRADVTHVCTTTG